MKNKITKEQFTELAKKHLVALKSYKMDKNGSKPIEIFGIEKLYEAMDKESKKYFIKMGILYILALIVCVVYALMIFSVIR